MHAPSLPVLVPFFHDSPLKWFILLFFLEYVVTIWDRFHSGYLSPWSRHMHECHAIVGTGNRKMKFPFPPSRMPASIETWIKLVVWNWACEYVTPAWKRRMSPPAHGAGGDSRVGGVVSVLRWSAAPWASCVKIASRRRPARVPGSGSRSVYPIKN
jgi:hypothetical protein